jgi:hypothetical protein
MRTDRNWIGFLVKAILCLLFTAWPFVRARACQCPLSQLGLEECNKYEIIFKGKIVNVKECGNKPGEATFEIEELYKGNATKEFKVLFECNVVCAQKFLVGEEWIIYSRYKQINNAIMDWCSRSRKYFRNDKEDFYATTYGNDYYDEVKFLKENLGVHRLLAENKTQSGNRNKMPDVTDTIIILLSSIGAIILFYFLFNKFFR